MNNIFVRVLSVDSPQVHRKIRKMIRQKKGHELEADLPEDKDALDAIKEEFGFTDQEVSAILRAPKWPVIIGFIGLSAIAVTALVFTFTRPDKTPPPEISSLKITETDGGSLKGTIPSIPGDDKRWKDFSHGTVTISEQDRSKVIYESRFEKNGLAFEVPANKVSPDSSYIVQAKTVDLTGNESQGIIEPFITRTPEVKDLANRFEDGAIVWEWSDSNTEGHLRITGPGNSLIVDEDFIGKHSYSLSGSGFKTGAVYTVVVQNRGRHGLSSGIHNSFTVPDRTVYHSLAFSGRVDKQPKVFRDRIKTEGLTESSTKLVVDYKYDAQSETNDAQNQISITLRDASGAQIGETKKFLFNSTSTRGGSWYLGGWVARTQRREVWELSYHDLAKIGTITVTIQAGDWLAAIDEVRYHFE
jgi:hypothetical protein